MLFVCDLKPPETKQSLRLEERRHYDEVSILSVRLAGSIVGSGKEEWMDADWIARMVL